MEEMEMDSRTLAFYDGLESVYDSMNIDYSTFKTSISIINSETGELIFKGRNKVIIPGAGLIARKLFDIKTPEVTDSYNTAFGTNMHTPTADTPPSKDIHTKATKDDHKILLFCCGIDGCGAQPSQVFPVDYRKWIDTTHMIPFRYQLGSNDISDSLRETYFGRTTINDGEYIAYYFKRFEGEPTFVQQYVDGTTVDRTIYTSQKKEPAESYVELNLKITKFDVRDYFLATTGIDDARLNSISLCSAYPVQEGNYVYFKEIRPVTKLHFPNEPFIDITKGIDIIYHIYM